jgi:DNA polymerase-3 subunit beta
VCTPGCRKNKFYNARATNLDLGIEIAVPAKWKRQESWQYPHLHSHLFINGINESGAKVKIELQQGNIKVTQTKPQVSLKRFLTMIFQAFHGSSGNSFSLNAADFVKGLKSVWYSSSVSSIKPELSSVYIYCENEFVVFVATDSFRLAEKRIKIKKTKDFGQILIPYKNIPEIMRVLEAIPGEVAVELDKNQISFLMKACISSRESSMEFFPTTNRLFQSRVPPKRSF